MAKFILFICNQHNVNNRAMVQQSFASLAKELNNHEVVICFPKRCSEIPDYLSEVFTNARFWSYSPIDLINDEFIDILTTHQPLMMYGYMFGGETLEENSILARHEFETGGVDSNTRMMGAILRLSIRNFNLHYYIVDPIEADPTVFGIPEEKIRRFYYVPNLDCGSENPRKCELNHIFIHDHFPLNENLIHNSDATNDVTFAMTAYSDSRVKQVNALKDVFEQLNTAHNLKTVFGYYKPLDAADNVDKRIPYVEYDKALRDSKVTFILPSYSSGTFSIARLIEAVKCGTLPVLLFDNNCSPYINDFYEFYQCLFSLSYLKNFADAEHIDDLAEAITDSDWRQKMFNLIVESDLFKHLNNVDNQEIEVKKFLNLCK